MSSCQCSRFTNKYDRIGFIKSMTLHGVIDGPSVAPPVETTLCSDPSSTPATTSRAVGSEVELLPFQDGPVEVLQP